MDLFSESEGSTSRSASPEVQSDDKTDFNINEEYASRFEHNKQRTELQQLEEKHGKGRVNGIEDELETESSSEDETEDEEGEQITADVDAAILTTLAKIRRKDESIYEAGKRVFDEERALVSKSKLMPRTLRKASGSREKVTLADYQRSRIQELLETSDDPARALADATMIQRRQDGSDLVEDDTNGPLSHTKEQEQLRREVTNAFHSMGEDGADDFFTRKDGAVDEDIEGDPESYRKFLLGVLGGKDKEEAVREILRAQTAEASAGDAPDPARGKAPKVRVEESTEQENEDFLMDYVLNRGWVENSHAAPKAKKNVKVKVDGKTGDEQKEGFSDVSSEDSFDSRAEAFENAYNFRFEELEGGAADPQIQSYARNPIGSVRRTEDKRKREREERAKRKELEKELKKKQIDRMRDLKRKSIVERLKALKEATGSSNVDFENFMELEEKEFDPEEHDRLMQQAFDDEYYQEQDEGKKPEWDDELDLRDAVKGKRSKKGTSKGKVKEDDEIEMDADFIDEGAPLPEKKLSKAEKKKLKKREKAKAKKHGEANEDIDDVEMDAETALPPAQELLDPTEKREKMKEAMDEYYGLEYEDMIGDQPTRFKYTQVPSSNYGLTPEEILLADDEDLQGIVSLKRLQPYREGRSRPSDLSVRVKEFRRKFHQSQETHVEEQEQKDKSKTKRMGKKERQRRKEAAERKALELERSGAIEEEPAKKKAKKV